MRLASSLILLFYVAGCAAANDASAACDRFASPRGSDAASGGADAPLRSPQRLADRLRPGQVGCLAGGVYATGTSGLILQLTRRDLTLRSLPGQRAQLRGSVAIEASARRARLTRLSIVGLGRQNTVKVYAPGFRLTDSDVTNEGRGESCVLLGNPAAGPAVRPVLEGNYFHDCGAAGNGNKDHAIYASYARGGRIAGNLIVRPAAYAIQLYPDARGMEVRRNVIDGSGSVRGGIVFGGDGRSGSADNRVHRNVIGRPATAAITTAWGGPTGRGNVAERNCTFGRGAGFAVSGVRLSGNVVAAGGFRDPSKGDFRLDATSLCQATGTDTVLARLRAAGISPAP